MSYYSSPQNDSGRFRERGDKRERDERNRGYSRLFVVCSKHHTQEDLREAFKDYGHIEDVWIVKDKSTKENRGIAYVQYSKMSEACLALESLNGKKISSDDGQALKVIMAQPRSRSQSQSNTDLEDATALTRLFVLIPRGMEESELREKFTEFGEIDYVQVVKDRNSGEKKGFGYVTFVRAYDAARALEDCDKVFKAVMAEPKAAKMKRDVNDARNSHPTTPLGSFPDLGFGTSRDVPAPSMPSFGLDDALRSSAIGNRLQVNCSYSLNSDQLARLFDLIPGMELCDLKKNFSTGESKGVAIVVYNSVGSATYAKEKLNGFEYPPGAKLVVRYAPDGEALPDVAGGYDRGVASTGASNASPSYCNVELPPPQARVKTDEIAERLFIVCQPTPPPEHALVDVFSRFGDLIDVFTLRNKNFGYAKYASVEAAEKAMQVLHGAEVCGSRLKVLAAEPPKTDESARKRPRT